MNAITARHIASAVQCSGMFITPSFNVPSSVYTGDNGTATETGENELGEVLQTINTIDYRKLSTEQLKALLDASPHYTEHDIPTALDRIELAKAPASNLIYASIYDHGKAAGYTDAQIAKYVSMMDKEQVDKILNYLAENRQTMTATRAAAIVYDFFIGLREVMQAGNFKNLYDIGVFDDVELDIALHGEPLSAITEDTSFTTDVDAPYGSGMQRDEDQTERFLEKVIEFAELDWTVDKAKQVLQEVEASWPTIATWLYRLEMTDRFTRYVMVFKLYSVVGSALEYVDKIVTVPFIGTALLSGDATKIDTTLNYIHTFAKEAGINIEIVPNIIQTFNIGSIEELKSSADILKEVASMYSNTYNVKEDLRGKDAENTDLYKYFVFYDNIIAQPNNIVEYINAVASRYFLGSVQSMALAFSKATSLTSTGSPRAYNIPTEKGVLDAPLQSIQRTIGNALRSGEIRSSKDIKRIQSTLDNFARVTLQNLRSEDTKEYVDTEARESNKKYAVDTTPIITATPQVLKEAIYGAFA